MSKKRPAFRKKKQLQAYDSPEELFGKLLGRAQSHGYLRGPQQDALRSYQEHQGSQNIALELPTGTGKTTVGLLIAEWHRRRTHGPVAYLTLTNQLAGQVLAESKNLGLSCADLRGDKYTRDASETGKYQSAMAVGVTTYSNLFNVNPIIRSADLLILDDAHGGEQYVTNMWTVEIARHEMEETYLDVLAALRPAMTDSQYRNISEESPHAPVELIDCATDSTVQQRLTQALDDVDATRVKFPWSEIRSNLHACVILASPYAVTIRPLIAPTHDHEPFSNARQRIYMSATLSGEADLLRGYGVTSAKVIQAQHPQWGKRYIFAPALYMDEEKSVELALSVFSNQQNRRALALTPSFRDAELVRNVFRGLSPRPETFAAQDIEEDISCFAQSPNAVLTLAGRYDGIDLPGEDCRLLMFWESPRAIGALERHQRECWKFGELLRRRERTRLTQGLGRCTRHATDYAVVLMLGQTMVDAFCNPLLVDGLPAEIQREIKWGREQGEIGRSDPADLEQMIIGILQDAEYRNDADENMEEIPASEVEQEPQLYRDCARDEVLFSRSLWAGDFSGAYDKARSVSDSIVGNELSGYRSWWLYIGSLAARLDGNKDGGTDCLLRSKAIGINVGFANAVLKRVSSVSRDTSAEEFPSQVEAIWNYLEAKGWHGPRFKTSLDKLVSNLEARDNSTSFHMGVEELGKFLGADAIRSTEDGAPDVVWIFSDRIFLFEAKSGKKKDNPISKTDLTQAKGHHDWVCHQREDLRETPWITVILPNSTELSDVAEPFARDVVALSATDFLRWARDVCESMLKIRAEFSGKDFAHSQHAVWERLKQRQLTVDQIEGQFEPLIP